MIIAPSLLASDYSRFGKEAARVAASGADWLHLDIMDGQFVPNISYGPGVVGAVRPFAKNLFFDVHLMCGQPEILLEPFVKAGADQLTIHVELAEKVPALLWNPGFGGQSFIHECLPKIQQADAWRRERKLKYRIEVDGGITNQTAAECARAGADTFVAGTSLFGARSLKAAVKKMRKIVSDNDPALADLAVPFL